MAAFVSHFGTKIPSPPEGEEGLVAVGSSKVRVRFELSNRGAGVTPMSHLGQGALDDDVRGRLGRGLVRHDGHAAHGRVPGRLRGEHERGGHGQRVRPMRGTPRARAPFRRRMKWRGRRSRRPRRSTSRGRAASAGAPRWCRSPRSRRARRPASTGASPPR